MKLLRKLSKHIRLSGSKEILRRYFITNAFDGILTTLGIVIGSYYINVKDPRTVIATGFGGAVAIAISGISSAYLSERAEKKKKIKDLEKAMLSPLSSSILAKAARTSVWVAAFINGLSPFTSSLIALTPFILAALKIIPVTFMYPASLFLCFILLFALGSYLGKIARENKLLYGLKTLIVGILVAFVLLFLKLI